MIKATEKTKAELARELSVAYPDLTIHPDMLTIEYWEANWKFGYFVIDGMDPHEWCTAMTMD